MITKAHTYNLVHPPRTPVLPEQAVKKARQFEVRKVARRLKAAREGDTALPGKEDQRKAVEKLQHQLEAAKALNIDAITKEVRAIIHGFLLHSFVGCLHCCANGCMSLCCCRQLSSLQATPLLLLLPKEAYW